MELGAIPLEEQFTFLAAEPPSVCLPLLLTSYLCFLFLFLTKIPLFPYRLCTRPWLRSSALYKPAMLHACNVSIREVEAGGPDLKVILCHSGIEAAVDDVTLCYKDILSPGLLFLEAMFSPLLIARYGCGRGWAWFPMVSTQQST